MFLYIDPGTGSMLFTILIGLFGTATYFFRNLIMKLKFSSHGKVEVEDKLPLVIFSDHKRYWNVFEPICNELEKRKIKCVYMTESEDDPVLSKDYEYIEGRFIGSGNKAYAKLNVLRAKILLSTTPSLDVFQWKRSKDVEYYVHIPHASSDISIYKMFGIDYYDSILLSGEYQGDQIRQLEEKRRLPAKEIEYVGIPYFDEMKKRLDEEKKTDKELSTRTVLLAPSWGPNSILNRFGADFIKRLIDTGYKVIVRPHPQSYTSEKEMIDKLKSEFSESDMFKWNSDNDNFNVLNESDILISDFSGVIFDYALVYDKPVIYAQAEFDSSTYDAAWIDDELWTFKVLPTIGRELSEEDFSDMKKIIDECIASEEYQAGRDKAREETWMYPGEGAVRVVDYLEKKLSAE
ncbi:CDP-Glycerol:Poly(glycerophosphate) glycerophosphotransferase [Lachnospiraceae bacterium]|nr:CDP-Glycerol:Poly(glycerophosphate) glycerophosphotransferase [Lachnospiraceae bacterium]